LSWACFVSAGAHLQIVENNVRISMNRFIVVWIE